MKKSNAHPKIDAGNTQGPRHVQLELPEAAAFVSKRFRVDPDSVISVCEEWLPRLMARPEFWERREADRCPAEFDLADPTRVPITYPAEFIDELLSPRREIEA